MISGTNISIARSATYLRSRQHPRRQPSMHSRLQERRRVRVGIVGAGNCASSLVQGLTYYRDARSNEPVPGLMNVTLGGYHVGGIEISAAFDVNESKVGKDIAEAIHAPP